MGVTGLWQILNSVGHPIKVEGLEGKRLGVDANVWLYKFIRGFRDKDNATSIDSHKLGLFNRISKLLFYKIKPVFVFDGPAPALKRKTLEKRQNVRNKQLEKVELAAMKLVAEQLKERYPEADIDQMMIKLPVLTSNNLVAAEKFTNEDYDLFYLPPEEKLIEDDEEDMFSDDSDVIEIKPPPIDIKPKKVEQKPDIHYLDQEYYQDNGEDVDIYSKEFESLPAEVRYELLKDIKESRRKIRRSSALPEDAGAFSNLQMERLRSRRVIQEKIEQCEKEICSMWTGECDGKTVLSYRVQSDASKTMVYLSNNQPSSSSSSSQPHIKPETIHETKKEENEEKTPETKAAEAQSTPPKRTPIQSGSAEGIAKRFAQFGSNKRSKKARIPSPPLSPKLSPSPSPLPSPQQSPRPAASSPAPSSPPPPTQPSVISLSSSSTSIATMISAHPSPSASPEPSTSTTLPPEASSPPFSSQPLEPSQPLSSQAETASPQPSPDHRPQHSTTILLSSSSSSSSIAKMIQQADSLPPSSPAKTAQTPPPQQSSSQPVQPSPATEMPSEARPERLSMSQPLPSAANVLEAQPAPGTSSTTTTTRGLYEEVARPHYNTVRQATKVTSKIVEEAKELLRLFGVPYIDATGEAEAQCALLEELNLTEGTITDDSDIWLFGAKNVYRHFFSDDKYILQYKMTDIEFHLRLTRENLVCFAMLVGSDYTDGIMNIGPVTAIEILSEFPGPSMEPLVKFRDWREKVTAKKPGNKKRESFLKFKLPDGFPSRQVFDGYMRPEANASTEKFAWGTPELDELRDYARRHFGWDMKRIDAKLLPVMKKLSERKTQPTIDSFFFKTAAQQDPEMFRSKRVNQALNKIGSRNDEAAEVAAAEEGEQGNGTICLTDSSDDESGAEKTSRKSKKAAPPKKTRGGAAKTKEAPKRRRK